MVFEDVYDEAIFEAERFIEKAKIARNNFNPWGNKDMAAAKRSSSDLSNALVALRRGYK